MFALATSCSHSNLLALVAPDRTELLLLLTSGCCLFLLCLVRCWRNFMLATRNVRLSFSLFLCVVSHSWRKWMANNCEL